MKGKVYYKYKNKKLYLMNYIKDLNLLLHVLIDVFSFLLYNKETHKFLLNFSKKLKVFNNFYFEYLSL